MTLAKKPTYQTLLASLLLLTAVSAGEPIELELLEFLAEWQTEDGQWIDPINFFGEEDNNQVAESEEGNQQ